jgi:hypothetical protein
MGDNDGGTGTTITDQGSGSNNGTLTNGPTYSPAVPPGYSRKAVDFDGTDDYALIDTGLESDLNNSSAISVSLWFYAHSYSAGGGNILFGTGTSATDAFYILPSPWSNTCYCAGSNGSTTYLTFPNPSLNEWHHIAFVWDSSSSFVYVDGSSVASGTLGSGVSATGGSNPTIGKRPYSNPTYPAYHNGLIDEVAVWNTALTGAQCVAIYNSGVPADLTSLNPVGWWRMGDGDTFPTLTDHGSGSNNGTMTNMTSGDIVTDTP